MTVTTYDLDTLVSRGYIDSSDLITRHAELESLVNEDATDDDDLMAEERAELAELTEIIEEGSGIPDWTYGVVLIPEYQFEDYARELANDIGAIDRDAGWPVDYIDWALAADALKMDYTEIEIRGVTYLGR